jgi:hypothetical protein
VPTEEDTTMTAQHKVIELLEWAKSHGLEPSRPSGSDLMLCPIRHQLIRARNLSMHIRQHAYWIPTRKGLKELGLPTKKEKIAGLVVLRSRHLTGAGPGEHEAALSLLNNLRQMHQQALIAA